jgi:hypothetical protein
VAELKTLRTFYLVDLAEYLSCRGGSDVHRFAAKSGSMCSVAGLLRYLRRNAV